MWLSLTLIFGTDRCGSLTRSFPAAELYSKGRERIEQGAVIHCSALLFSQSATLDLDPAARTDLNSILKLNLAYSLLKVNICQISTPGAEIGTESMIRLQLWLGFRSKATTEVILGQIHAFLHANITFLSEVVRRKCRAISGAVLILHKSWI